MNVQSKHLTKLLIVSILMLTMVSLTGCKKSEPSSEATVEKMQEHAAMSSESAKEIASSVEQTTCPVMGNAINKDIFVEYKGKKVYFCCPPCKEKFEEAPEEYIAKLPQFSE